MADAPAASTDTDAQPVVFISRQKLLAEAVGRMIALDGRWSVTVLDQDHPDLLAQATAAGPIVVIVDVDTQVVPGLTLTSTLVSALPGASVLVLGDFTGQVTAAALEAGARGCLTYAASADEVLDAVDAAAAGRTSVGSSALRALVGGRLPAPRPGAKPKGAELSARELEILRQLADGRSTHKIAQDLGISVQTVRKHTQNILGKLGVHSRLSAAALAVRDGLV